MCFFLIRFFLFLSLTFLSFFSFSQKEKSCKELFSKEEISENPSSSKDLEENSFHSEDIIPKNSPKTKTKTLKGRLTRDEKIVLSKKILKVLVKDQLKPFEELYSTFKNPDFIIERPQVPYVYFQRREPLIVHVAEKNYDTILKFLLDKGANINATDGLRQTALSSAINRGALLSIEVLLEPRYKVDFFKDHYDMNILMDFSKFNPKGRFMEDYLGKRIGRRIIKKYKEKGLINAQHNLTGYTALHMSIENAFLVKPNTSSFLFAEALIKAGADLSLKDEKGRTAKELALFFGYEEFAQFLESFEKKIKKLKSKN